MNYLEFSKSKAKMERLAEIFKMFGNESRLKILMKLSEGEAMAGDLAQSSGLSAPATSHQLKDLKNCGIVKSRKDGLKVWYSLDDDHVEDILIIGIEHVDHTY